MTCYQTTPEKNEVGKAEYINGIIFRDEDVNVLKYTERKMEKGVEIENQGFNRQKRWQGDIEHACSFHEKAQKNHYLMEQISDFIKQLYEFFFLQKNEIKKAQKNISSDLLASFGRQLTREDISKSDMHSISKT